jgi:hypothetical protein
MRGHSCHKRGNAYDDVTAVSKRFAGEITHAALRKPNYRSAIVYLEDGVAAAWHSWRICNTAPETR